MLWNKRGDVVYRSNSNTVHNAKEASIILPFTMKEYRKADCPFGAYCPQKIIPAIKWQK